MSRRAVKLHPSRGDSSTSTTEATQKWVRADSPPALHQGAAQRPGLVLRRNIPQLDFSVRPGICILLTASSKSWVMRLRVIFAR